MPSLLHFRRQMGAPPVAPEVQGVSVRSFDAPNDIGAWLELRNRAMADQTPAVRPWSHADFETEMLSKPWWRPDRTWLAIAGHRPKGGRSPGVSDLQLAGSVT